jgi:hypothetical protein
MDDAAFWRHAGSRFTKCDPRVQIDLNWQNIDGVVYWDYSDGDDALQKSFDQLLRELGGKLHPEAPNPKDAWLTDVAVRAGLYHSAEFRTETIDGSV